MTAEQTNEWQGGWTAADPADIGYAWAPNDDGEYVDDGTGFLARDLGLQQVSGGALGVRRLKVGDPAAASDWRALEVDFDFLYVLSGGATVDGADGSTRRLDRGGVAIHPRGYAYRLHDFSADFEAVHVTAPASFDRTLGAPAQATSQPGVPRYSHDTDDQYIAGDGPRAYFLYRDLDTREATDDRIHFHIVRATQGSTAGTGWHFHTMAQWFMVIGGSAAIRVEDGPLHPLGWGDAMCVGRGPHMRHNVTDFSSDYLVLEMCVPAEYETTAVDAPENAAAQ